MARSKLPATGSPNTSAEERDAKGKVIQRRFYGADGKAIKDIVMTTITAPECHTLTTGTGRNLSRFACPVAR